MPYNFLVEFIAGRKMYQAPDYLFDPANKPSLPLHNVPVLVADEINTRGYGYLVERPDDCEVEIVRWPATGWRRVDCDCGNEGGVVEGEFHGRWSGNILYGSNKAVGGEYVLGWEHDPHHPPPVSKGETRSQVLLWHMNYHPDGGQLFFPLEKKPFVVPVALPGDDLKPDKIIAFWCDGSTGLYIHPNIWHEGIFPVTSKQRFLDRQGRVHARVSCDIGKEFGVYLAVPLSVEQPE